MARTEAQTSRAENRRWEIARLALGYRAQIVGYAVSRFRSVPRYRVEELYDKVWERATKAPDEPAAFPRETYERLRAWLTSALINELRHEIGYRQRPTVHDAIDEQASTASDPALVVEQRDTLDFVLRAANSSLSSDTKRYLAMTQIAGLKRAEFQRRTGWSHRRIQRVRKEWTAFAIRMRDSVAALMPWFLVKRLLGGSGASVAGVGGTTVSGKAILATCGAAAVCAGGTVGAVELERQVNHSRSDKRAKVEATAAPIASSAANSTSTAGDPQRTESTRKARPDKKRPRDDNGSVRLAKPKENSPEAEFGYEASAATSGSSTDAAEQSSRGSSPAASGTTSRSAGSNAVSKEFGP